MIIALAAAATFDLTVVAPRGNEMELVHAVKKAATGCSVKSIAEPTVASVEAEPTDQDGKTALDEQTLDLMKDAGFARDRKLHPVTFDAIRAMLITKVYIRVVFKADVEAKACMDKWYQDNNFTLLARDHPIPSELE